MAVDRNGRVYVADSSNHRVRRVDAEGIITTLAGTGESGYGGDGGSASEAQLDYPGGVAVDARGRVYVADRRNARIRRIDASGVITTIAGTGARGASGDGGPASEAELQGVSNVAIDAGGNVYVATWQRVRRIDPSGTITTLAGSGEWSWAHAGGIAMATPLDSPDGVAVTASGDIVFIDRNRAWRLDVSGVMAPFAGTGYCCYRGEEGPATTIHLNTLGGITADAAGNVYLAERWGHRILRINVTTQAPS